MLKLLLRIGLRKRDKLFKFRLFKFDLMSKSNISMTLEEAVDIFGFERSEKVMLLGKFADMREGLGINPVQGWGNTNRPKYSFEDLITILGCYEERRKGLEKEWPKVSIEKFRYAVLKDKA